MIGRVLPNFRITRRAFSTTVFRPSQTLVEKIVSNYTVGTSPGYKVRSGDYVMIKPEHIMTHDNTGPVISKFKTIGAKSPANPRQPVFTIDHDVQNKSEKNLEKYSKMEAFAKQHNIDFYPAGRGIGHQILIEEGYAWPQSLVVASDSHSNMYGGVGCLGTPIVRTDAAAIWATERTWWQVPPVVKVELKGKLSPGVTGKDVIVALCGNFNKDEVLNSVIEFVGDGVNLLSIDERLAIANMTTEWGALAGVFPVDDKTITWYESQAKKLELGAFSNFAPSAGHTPGQEHPRINAKRIEHLKENNLKADSDASYAAHLILNLETLVPHVSGPNSVKVSTPLPQLTERKVKIDKAYLVSCTNSRASDIKAAADIVRNKKIADGVEFYIAAASAVVQSDSEQSGDWQTLVNAGAKTLPAGCGPCIGLGTGLLEDGQVGISATNRNYKGRMGSPNALAYLASPAVVAASAVKGYISGPNEIENLHLSTSNKPEYSIEKKEAESTSEKPIIKEDLLPGFPASFEGPLIFAPQDNLTTDGMYPGKYTYQDDITPEKQADVVMENYDPSFAKIIKKLHEKNDKVDTEDNKNGVILASGFNFGTGSSREQAATAIKNAGIPLVLGGSFGDVYRRNAINNGLIVIECPELIKDLTKEYTPTNERGKGGLNGEQTIHSGKNVRISTSDGKIDIINSEGNIIKTYIAARVGTAVQDIWIAGGLEGWVKNRL
ncbi:homoaconitase [Wallemia mellicola]|uniref:Homoaconitase, mitochondrial n=2 Tax=Wallemia mellicola TaxID=1708541 RepID=A0A4T0RJE8_9BASI|nr:homoaconitase [Wallemia mellicola CBS 633.66]TIB70491.1 hypothetical protein E3Q23_04155 [Wallemia mellicola]EIM23942.1 homoaconitase [Wallemia mellicola CBS 633.66]TIB78342.1 homoaconitase [Wallemia mellicola]TIB79643.1 homoaconitase [Wallemia mellicola]TIB83647.1 homoaconitase [Wallemia mellicola]|eukprot:XP_006955781.1 homoaconitase [Wallemia mellicola CBS 633.66]